MDGTSTSSHSDDHEQGAALADVKAHLSELVSEQHERVTVTVRGRPSAVLLAPDDLASLEETIAVLSDTETMRRLNASDDELAHGEVGSEQDLAAALARRRSAGR